MKAIDGMLHEQAIDEILHEQAMPTGRDSCTPRSLSLTHHEWNFCIAKLSVSLKFLQVSTSTPNTHDFPLAEWQKEEEERKRNISTKYTI
jgi:hypothetical protein